MPEETPSSLPISVVSKYPGTIQLGYTWIIYQRKDRLPDNCLFHDLIDSSKKMDPPIVLPARSFCIMLSRESHHITDSLSVHIDDSLVTEDYPLLLFHRTYNEFPTFRSTCLWLFPRRVLSSTFVVSSKPHVKILGLSLFMNISFRGSYLYACQSHLLEHLSSPGRHLIAAFLLHPIHFYLLWFLSPFLG